MFRTEGNTFKASAKTNKTAFRTNVFTPSLLHPLITLLYLNDHLYDFDLDEALTLLSPQRRQQALRFRHEQGRRECVAAYLLLCQGLRQEYGITEPPLFDYSEHGKPSIVGHPDIHFNLSHCREAAVCMLSDRPVGVDVETLRSYNERLVAYTMNEQEQAQISAATSPRLEFIRLWTQKEAVMKLSGTGITNDLKHALDSPPPLLRTIVAANQRYVYSYCQ